MIRLGLVCIFREEPVRFRRTTARFAGKLHLQERLQFLSTLILENIRSLKKALQFCAVNGIGDFRINSQILPLKTHPDLQYDLADLPDHEQILTTIGSCRQFCLEKDLRTTFHPDQFVLLSSPRPEVVEKSILELDHQAQLAEMIGSDVINIHGGGAYGDKNAALKRLMVHFGKLPERIRTRLTLENDDRVYTPEDLFPVCEELGIPLVYDVHHHRCLEDGLSIEVATDLALKTWNREPLFHLSSPKKGWGRGDCRLHHDYIDIRDFPQAWTDLDVTVEIEAKAKELAVMKFKTELQKNYNIKL